MSAGIVAWIADALVVLGAAVITISVYGLFRMPDVYMQLHAAGKAAFVGLVALLGASAIGDAAIAARAVLIAAFLAVTTPVAAHAVARAAFQRDEHMHGHPAVDESGRRLDLPRERGGGG